MRESQGSGRLMKYHHSKMYAIKLLSGILAVLGFPSGWDSRVCLQCRRPVFSPWVGWSTGEGNGYPPQYSFLDNSMDRGAWWTTVHEVTESDTSEQLKHTAGSHVGRKQKIFSFYPCNPKNCHLVVPDGLCLFIFNWKNFQEPFFFSFYIYKVTREFSLCCL